MAIIILEQTQSTLADVIHRLMPGEEVTILENNRAIARLWVSPSAPAGQASLPGQWPCQAGSARGKIQIAADFDEPLEEFQDYRE